MSTTTPEPNAQPTQADAIAVGQAAAAAAAQPAPGQTPQSAAHAAVDSEASARGIVLSDEEKRQIATMAAEMSSAMTVDQLRKAGALDPPVAPAAAPVTTTAVQPSAGSTTPTEPVQEPRKKSWAERHGFGG